MVATPPHILAAAAHPDPYPFYADLVARAPLAYDDRCQLWVAASAAAVQELLATPHGRVRPLAEPVPGPLLGTPVEAIYRLLVRMRDDPARQPLKGALATSLTALSPSLVAERSAALAERLGPVPEPERAPAWLSSFILRLPVEVVASLLGAPEADLPQVSRQLQELVACLRPGADGEILARGSAAATALRDYVARLPALSEPAPGQSAALRLTSHGAGQQDAEALVANGVGLLMQSYEATAGLIGNALVALATRPALRARLRDDPELLYATLREVLRYDPPIQNTRRYLASDLQIGWHTLRAGQEVLVVLAAANRDPEVNPDPARFDPYREAPRCFTFGLGSHACPGEQLTLAIAAAAVRYLLAKELDLEQLVATVTYLPLVNARVPRFGVVGPTA